MAFLIASPGLLLNPCIGSSCLVSVSYCFPRFVSFPSCFSFRFHFDPVSSDLARSRSFSFSLARFRLILLGIVRCCSVSIIFLIRGARYCSIAMFSRLILFPIVLSRSYSTLLSITRSCSLSLCLDHSLSGSLPFAHSRLVSFSLARSRFLSLDLARSRPVSTGLSLSLILMQIIMYQ